MHVNLTTGPLSCSKCGSINCSRPLNQRSIEVRCDDCGHFKLTREAERAKFEEEHPEMAKHLRAQSWGFESDKKPTF